MNLNWYNNTKIERRDTAVIFALLFVFISIVKVVIFYQYGWKWQVITSMLSAVLLLLFSAIILSIDSLLERIIPYEQNVWKRIVAQFALSVITVISFRLMLLQPMERLTRVYPSRELILASFGINVFAVATVVLSIFVFRFVRRWKAVEMRQSALEREKAIVQYDHLKNQLNPHFLFNALNSLDALIHENPHLASSFVQQLSQVYRYALSHKDETFVTVEKELEHVAQFINLLKMRFEEGLNVHIAIEGSHQQRIMPVTLQILLENAVKHNITSKRQPLHIAIIIEKNQLRVRNNIQLKESLETSNRQGLAHLNDLYKTVTGRPLQAISANGEFEVIVPLVESPIHQDKVE
ncbi:MAG: histidine kinase [Chitinophagales bacterium]